MQKTNTKQKLIPIIPDERIVEQIYFIRGEKVMFDRDLAELYEVKTKELNKAIKRNIKRFPADFMFQLNKQESEMFLRFQIGTLNKDENLISQSVISKKGRGQHLKYLPYVFTEQGVAMLSAILKSDRAVEVSIHIVRVFIKMRKLLSTHKELREKIEKMELENKENFKIIFKVIAKLMATEPKSEGLKIIGFDYSKNEEHHSKS